MKNGLTIAHLTGDETGIELGEQMRILAAAAEKAFGLNVDWTTVDLSLGSRTESNNDVVREAADLVRRIGFGIKDATITLEADDERPGIRKSPNGLLRKGLQEPDSTGTIIYRNSQPLPGIRSRVLGGGYEDHSTGIVRQGGEGFYEAKIGYSGDGRPRRGDMGQEVITPEKVRRTQHRAAAMFAFMQAQREGAQVVGGPKFTIHDGDGAFQREIRRA